MTDPSPNLSLKDLLSGISADGSHGSSPGTTIAPSTRITDVSSNPNFEQFGGRTVPFLGDYIWVSSLGDTSFGVWTDYRNTVGGVDLREAGDNDNDPGADVLQCRTALADGSITGDTCPRAGGLDQDIYGDKTP